MFSTAASHSPPAEASGAARSTGVAIPAEKRKSLRTSTHWLYLAVIVVLVIIIVYLVGRMVRIGDFAKSIRKRYGLFGAIRASTARPSPLRDLSSEQLLAERTFDQYRNEFNQVIDRAFALGDFDDRRNIPTANNTGRSAGGQAAGPTRANSTLQAACHQALKGGKRLRPIILMEIARMVSRRRFEREQMIPVDPADAAIAVECFHASSLIIDDLPAFDNDRERRGEPSVWAATSQATALMAAIAVIAGAFQNVCRQVDWIRENCPEWINADKIGTLLCSQISSSLGVLGAASGQFMDMLPPNQLSQFVNGPPPATETTPSTTYAQRSAVQTLVQRKTSPFFEMTFVCGWLVGGGDSADETIAELRRAGRDFGTAFQIADDIGDLEQDRARREAGKPGWNYADIYGEEQAELELFRRLNACRSTLRKFGLFTPLWQEIYGKVVKMAVS